MLTAMDSLYCDDGGPADSQWLDTGYLNQLMACSDQDPAMMPPPQDAQFQPHSSAGEELDVQYQPHSSVVGSFHVRSPKKFGK